MDQNRRQAQQQDTRNSSNQSWANTQPSPARWDGKDRRTGMERRHGVAEPGMDMDMEMMETEGSDR